LLIGLGPGPHLENFAFVDDQLAIVADGNFKAV
jgi:hypothetical protein